MTTITESNPVSDTKEIIDNLDYKLFYKLAKTVKLSDEIKAKIGPNDKITFYSEDRIESKYADLLHLIDKGLVRMGLDNNYTVLERNQIPLIRIFGEKVNQNSIIFPSYNSKDSAYNQKLAINSVDKFISYTVFDAGIKKTALGDKIQRIVYISAHLKLIEAATSKILGSQDVELSSSDEIDFKLNDKIVQFHMDNTNANLPVRYGYLESDGPEKNLNKSSSSKVTDKIMFSFKLGFMGTSAVIYDGKGKEIMRVKVPSSYKSPDPDIYTWEWDMKDAKNNKVPLGNYFIGLLNVDGQLLEKQGFEL
jgi:hypothetical protein